MFPNQGPVAAQIAVRNYVASVGLNAFPDEYRAKMQELINLGVFDVLTLGVERLYAALTQLEDLPNRLDALTALGEAAQSAAINNLSSKSERWWAISSWASAELTEPGVENPLSPAPEVDQNFSFIAPPPAIMPPIPVDQDQE